MWNTLAGNWVLLVGVAAVLVALWVGAVLSKYVRLMLNIVRETPSPPLMRARDCERLEGLPCQFRAFDGTALRGMFLAAEDLVPTAEGNPRSLSHYLRPDRPGVVIFCHEWGSDRYSCAAYCRGLLEQGYAVFSFDFRGHGASSSADGYQPRVWCTDKEVSDCLGALLFVRDQLQLLHVTVPVGLFGISRGAGAALLAAAHPHCPLAVEAVVADSVFSSELLLEYFMKKWAHIFARVRFIYENHPPIFWRFLSCVLFRVARGRFHCRFPSVRRVLRRLEGTAVFFVQGDKDQYICREHAQQLFRGALPPRYFWLVPDAKHNQSVIADPGRYAARTVAFFDRHLRALPVTHLAVQEAQRRETAEFFGWRSWQQPTAAPAAGILNHDQPHRGLLRQPARRPAAEAL